jgi:hypothetical protein
MTAPRTGILLALVLLPAAAYGQTYNLSEAPKPGECYRIAIDTALSGDIKIMEGGKENSIKLAAACRHSLLERVLDADKGVVRKSARYYETAMSQADVAGNKMQRDLRDERRLVVAQRYDDNALFYSPVGPLSRSELEVVSEHFDTLCLTGLLPGKEVSMGETWKVGDASVQALCLFEGLVAHDLTGKLTDVKDGQAVIAVEGKAGGIELGAAVKLEIAATVRFDLLYHRLVSLEWKQKDTRQLGPASPASQVESTTILKRTQLTEEPQQLMKASLIGVPPENDPPELMKLLQYKDPAGRFKFLYARDWHIVGQTDSQLVMRLMDRGDFVAQVTIATWKKQEPGQHVAAEDFKKLIVALPGWEMEEMSEAGEVPTDSGRWMYRIAAKGSLDGKKVVQNFVMLAGPGGDQLLVTFVMKPANAGRIGTKDLALVNAIELGKK